MELASDVTNLNDVLLLARGTVLNYKQIRILKMWGIEMVDIAGPEAQPEAAISQAPLLPEVLASAEEYVNQRFKHVPINGPVVAAIRNIAIKRKAAQLARSPKPPGNSA